MKTGAMSKMNAAIIHRLAKDFLLDFFNSMPNQVEGIPDNEENLCGFFVLAFLTLLKRTVGMQKGGRARLTKSDKTPKIN